MNRGFQAKSLALLKPALDLRFVEEQETAAFYMRNVLLKHLWGCGARAAAVLGLSSPACSSERAIARSGINPCLRNPKSLNNTLYSDVHVLLQNDELRIER
jgi:hypothetical protein